MAGRQGRLRLQVRDPLLAVDQGLRPGRRPGAASCPPSRPHGRRLGAQRRHARRPQGAGQRGRPRRARPRAQHHQGRARPAQPRRHQLHPRLPGPRHPRLGRAHALERPGLALPQRAPALQLRRGVDPRGHPVGRLRAERHRALGHASSAPSTRSCAASGATARCSARRRSEAFYVKCDEETNPPEVGRRRPARRRDRHRAGEAGRVRHLPHRPVLGRRRTSASSHARPDASTRRRHAMADHRSAPRKETYLARDRRRRRSSRTSPTVSGHQTPRSRSSSNRERHRQGKLDHRQAARASRSRRRSPSSGA